MADHFEIARRLRAVREASGLSREKFARMAGLPDGHMVYKAENGVRKLSAEELLSVSATFGVSLHFWLGVGSHPNTDAIQALAQIDAIRAILANGVGA